MTPMKNREAYDRILPYIEQAARDYYSDNLEKGFLHWAFREVFIQEDFSNDDVISSIAIDGPDDFGIDGYYIDHESKIVHLFQSKHLTPGARFDEAWLADFWESPKRLVDPTRMVKCRNEETRTLSSEFSRHLPEGYSLHLVIATTGDLNPSTGAGAFVESHKKVEDTIVSGSSKFPISIELEAYDLQGLVELFENHLAWVGVDSPDVIIELIPGQFHEIRQQFNAIRATVYAKEIVRIFEANGNRIFRLNPRGPLSNKVNAGMLKSLQNDVYRPIFHLLNNGLSIICDGYRLKGSRLTVRNFQIVNGCQTTVTLDKAKSLLGDVVLVDIKIIESIQMAPTIAETTNTQAGLKAQDFISTDIRQNELQKQFDAMADPWFYEIRRGEWARMVKKSDKQKYRRTDGKSYRVLHIKDVAQAALAFKGMPGEAKDHTKTIFEHKTSDQDDQRHYEDVFSSSTTAKQLYLSWLILSKVKDVVASEDTSGDYPGYGRLHSVWLVGELIRQHYVIKSDEVVPEDLAIALSNRAEEWFKPLYFIVKQALKMAVDSERSLKGDTYSNREFFRGTRNIIREKLPIVLDYARQYSEDPLQKLPRWKKRS